MAVTDCGEHQPERLGHGHVDRRPHRHPIEDVATGFGEGDHPCDATDRVPTADPSRTLTDRGPSSPPMRRLDDGIAALAGTALPGCRVLATNR